MILALFPLEREARPFRRLCPRVRVHLTGVGVERACTAVEGILKHSTPSLVILAGFGGALTPASGIGDVIVAADVSDETGKIWPSHGTGLGRVLTVDRMIASIEEKLALGRRFQATVCDMESTAVAAVCAAKSIPFVAVRAISDTATRALPAILSDLIVDGQVSPRKAAIALLKQPWRAVEFYRLARDTRHAAKMLAHALKAIVEDPLNL